MKGEWCYYKSYFSREYCNSILERSKDLEFKKANLGEDGLTNNGGVLSANGIKPQNPEESVRMEQN